MRILVIEDEPKLGDYLKKSLEENGYVVDIARDGIEGKYLATEGDYALILLDVVLPGIDGFAVLQSIRRTRNIPVLVLTARDKVEDRVQGLQHGESIDAGEHHIQENQRVVSLGGEVTAFDAVAGYVDDISVFLESLFQVVAQFGLVFDDKNSHSQIVPNSSQNTGYDLVILLTDKAPR